MAPAGVVRHGEAQRLRERVLPCAELDAQGGWAHRRGQQHPAPVLRRAEGRERPERRQTEVALVAAAARTHVELVDIVLHLDEMALTLRSTPLGLIHMPSHVYSNSSMAIESDGAALV